MPFMSEKKQYELACNFALILALFSVCFLITYSEFNKAFGKPIKVDDAVVVELVGVYDGDTFYVNIADWPPIIGKKIGIRIAGIDTPELSSLSPTEQERAKLAKNRLSELLTTSKEIKIHNLKRDKYFRILSSVRVDDVDVASILIKEGLAKKYHGEKK